MATKQTDTPTQKLSAAARAVLGQLTQAGDGGVAWADWSGKFPTRTLELLEYLGFVKAGKLKKGDNAKYPPYFATAKGKKHLEKLNAKKAA